MEKLIEFCQSNNITFDLKDERLKLESVKFDSKFTLYDHQTKAIQDIGDKESGVIVAPSGSGKTVIGLNLIAKRQQPALILVHRQQLADQWLERIESFLGIPKAKIGQLSGRKKKIGDKITVAMIQSLVRLKDEKINELANKFGLIIVDECHHIPAKTFRDLISEFNAYYLYGLTATPKRKYNDEKLIYYYLGNVIATIDPDYQKELLERGLLTTINICNTQLTAPFDYQVDQFETISKILIFDTARNSLLCRHVSKEV